MKTEENRSLAEIRDLAEALGKGLLAGLVGTVAITASQMIEMKFTGRGQSSVPADAASKVLGVQSVNEEEKTKFATLVHWAYGTSWGTFRGLLSEAGIKGWPATASHFIAIYGTAMIIQPTLEVAPPLREWDSKTLISGGIHHAVYSLTAGMVYDALDKIRNKDD